MAAFSHHHQALLLDSHFSSNNNNNNNNSPIIPSSFDFISEQPSSYDNDNFIQTSNSLIFSQFCPPADYNLHKSSLTDTPSQSDVENESSVTKKLQSPQSSVVVDCYNFNHNCKIESGDEQVTQTVTTNPSPPLMDRKRKYSAKLKDGTQKAVKNKKQRKGNGIQKKGGGGGGGGGGGEEEATGEKETSINTSSTTNNSKKMKPKKKVTEFPPKDYIHVRARRGQATDNHSLAERVRREKISQRMKALQKLVPGCDKVTGKALMLDEIINYVQSLQNQVEFLSMKLASVNPMFYDFGMDLFDNAFMVGPFENLLNTSVSPPLLSSSLPQCGSTTQQPFTTFANTIGTTAACLTAMENYPFHVPVVDSSIASIQQAQRIPNSFPQDNESVLWDHVEDQKQKFLNTTSSGMILSNSLCSFH